MSRAAATVVLPVRAAGLRLRLPGRRGALRLGVAAALGLGGVSAGSLLAGRSSTRQAHVLRTARAEHRCTRLRSGSRRSLCVCAIETGRCGWAFGAGPIVS